MEAENKTVKSARRVFEVLEFFSDRRPQASASEIAAELGYPQSSTSELLRSLVSLGYLVFQNRKYHPSARVALLGSWILPSLFRNGRLFDLMEEVARESNENVILATEVNLAVRYIYIVRPASGDTSPVPLSSDRPMLTSSFGKLLLSTLPDDQLRATVDLLNARARNGDGVSVEQLMPAIQTIRRKGYSLSTDQYQEGSGALSVLLPIEEDDMAGQLAIGIAGLSSDMIANESRHFDILSAAIDRHIPRRLHRIRR